MRIAVIAIVMSLFLATVVAASGRFALVLERAIEAWSPAMGR